MITRRDGCLCNHAKSPSNSALAAKRSPRPVGAALTDTARGSDALFVLQEDELVTEGLEIVARGVLIGIGGTVILDLWAAFMQRVFNAPATNWAMVGRWVGHMPRGRFVHENIGRAAPVSGELAIGWIVHYVIGIAYGLLLVGLWGVEWLREPTLLHSMILALALLVAPYFIMMPGMGAGIAGAKTPKPNVTRLKSVVGHSVFGFGMYATALMIEAGVGRIPAALAGSLI